MHAFLIISENVSERNAYITAQLDRLNVSSFDRIEIRGESATIGIADIRAFIKKISMMPQSGSRTAGIIHEAEHMSAESQQALLKTLEEPPAHASIYIGAGNTETVLPTILSRCQCIFLGEPPDSVESVPTERVRTLLPSLFTMRPGETLALVSSIGKTKEDSTAWVSTVIAALRQNLLSSTSGDTDREMVLRKTKLLHSMLHAKKYERNNVSRVLLLEHALLTFS